MYHHSKKGNDGGKGRKIKINIRKVSSYFKTFFLTKKKQINRLKTAENFIIKMKFKTIFMQIKKIDKHAKFNLPTIHIEC